MSAITGVVYRDGRPVARETVTEMIERLNHRGPDGRGVWTSGHVGLGQGMLHATPESLHERQPLVHDAGDFVLTADARIDNREELITIFDLSDRRPEPITDGELILRAYERWGERCPAHLLGVFSFAIWDARKQTLFCARDHFGVKPFYYYLSPRTFACASEIKALFCVPDVPRRLNEVRIADYLALTFDDKSITFYKDIFRLPPAHSVAIRPDTVRITRYWEPDLSRTLRYKTDKDYEDAFREHFTDAIRCRLRSAYPVGSMLSGGLDSSSIVCTAGDLLAANGNGRLHTFSAIFPSLADSNPDIDERAYINSVLDHNTYEPHFVRADTWSPLIDLLWRDDEAVPAPNLYMDWAIFDAAHQEGVRVVLSGFDGDSTVSYGYELLPVLLRSGRWSRLLHESDAMARRLDAPRGRVLWYLALKPLVPEPAVKFWRRVRGHEQERWPSLTAINPAFAEYIDLYGRLRALYQSSSGSALWHSTRRLHWNDLSSGLLSYALDLLDKTAAACSVEVRYPFFDRRLVEFCLALPPEQKLQNGWTRSILRRAMADRLPAAVQTRMEKGNLSSNFTTKLLDRERETVEQAVFGEADAIARYVDLPQVRSSLRRCLTGSSPDHRDVMNVYAATILSLWLRQSDAVSVVP